MRTEQTHAEVPGSRQLHIKGHCVVAVTMDDVGCNRVTVPGKEKSEKKFYRTFKCVPIEICKEETAQE